MELQKHVGHSSNHLEINIPYVDSVDFSSLKTEIVQELTPLGMRFARKLWVLLVVPVVRSAWRKIAHPKEKDGAVTARRLPHPFHKARAYTTDHAEGLQDLPMVNAPVVGNKSTHLPAFSRPSVKTRLMARMELKVSVETETGGEATALQMILNLMESQFVHGFHLVLKLLQGILQSLLVALVVKSVSTHLAPQKGNNGVASVRRKRRCCLRVLVSLTVLVLELQTALMKTPLVPAAIQNMFLHAIKRRNVGMHSMRLV